MPGLPPASELQRLITECRATGCTFHQRLREGVSLSEVDVKRIEGGLAHAAKCMQPQILQRTMGAKCREVCTTWEYATVGDWVRAFAQSLPTSEIHWEQEGPCQEVERFVYLVRLHDMGEFIMTTPRSFHPLGGGNTTAMMFEVDSLTTASQLRCHHCGNVSLRLRLCRRCIRIRYCSDECRRADRLQHKPMCDLAARKGK